MPTPAEKKALLFLASVALLGASVRALRAVGSIEKLPQQDSRALQTQLAAVDSARRAKQGGAKTKASRARGRHRLPPDSLSGSDSLLQRRLPNGKSTVALHAGKIDVDMASASELDALPGVGPVLARRIIVDREKHGPFGSLVNLRRVKGIGATLAARLDSLVTFSGTPRPPSATPMDSSGTERQQALRAGGASQRRRGDARLPNASASGRDSSVVQRPAFSRPLPPPAQWPLPSSPSSESAISSSAKGSSRASSSRARSKSSGKAAPALDTISSSSASSKKTS
ncbi:MAG TPA: helix-hairpin-helix domain-containing protein [Gemmatimonadaceae bacterium]|nr:helix-hairpin-helix domain-containing protein [Gemmatimonadaceae bacterium]